MLLEFNRAEGLYLIDRKGRKHLDLISGICVNNLGHLHPKITQAIKEQANRNLHTMAYGEFIEESQVAFAKNLAGVLPRALSSVYFVNSGSEAIEGAIKLARKYTSRKEIVSFKNAYHGSTNGALSIIGDETYRTAFGPLLEDVKFIVFNNEKLLSRITKKTACVIVEPIQGEAGVVLPGKNYLKALKQRCRAVGALLIFDEIQTGMGRTGKLFAFEHFKVIPDIVTLAKALGGGLPLGAFISSQKIMVCLKKDPVLGHITTFGGNPLSCAAGNAMLNELKRSNIMNAVEQKGQRFAHLLVHPAIRGIRYKGLLMAVELASESIAQKVIKRIIDQRVIVDWFLFSPESIRISPPLTIEDEQIEHACKVFLKAMDIAIPE